MLDVVLAVSYFLAAKAPAKPVATPATGAAESPAWARTCRTEEATAAYRHAFEEQYEIHTDAALAGWKQCLKLDPDCVPCLYESGWTHWSRSEWDDTVTVWDRVLVLDSADRAAHGKPASKTRTPADDARNWIQQARENRAIGARGGVDVSVPIGTQSTAGTIGFELVARFQNYDSHPLDPRDHYDDDVHSPKSVRVAADGSKVWVNSLAGARTIVYDAATLEKKKVLQHSFGDADAKLFAGSAGIFPWKFFTKSPDGDTNHFRGFPVESTLTHAGKFLWIPYYRREWDVKATSPSALAVIDSATDSIVRILPAGPIPKYVAASPDGKWLAVVHWGDNTIGLIDVSSPEPKNFRYVKKLVVEQELPLAKMGQVNRDKVCGFCLRGTVFTPDSKMLLVARMGGGGIAGFDIPSGKYLGTVNGMKPTPRHLALSADGASLYMSSNVSGFVSKIPLATVTGALAKAGGKAVDITGFEDVYVGGGARTLAVSPDGKTLFVAVQGNAELVAVDAATLSVVGRIRADAYPVGLAVLPDGKTIWVTSQGRTGRGGNSVCVYRVHERTGADFHPLSTPTPRSAAGGLEE